MKKTYRVLADNGIKLKLTDRSELSGAKDAILTMKTSEYDKFSGIAPAILRLMTKWQSAISSSVVDEAQTSTTTTTVDTTWNIDTVEGVWLATDTGHTGTNYYTGGSINGNTITLGTALAGATTNVIINYTALGRTVTTTGGTVAFTKTFEDSDIVSDQKLIKATFTIGGTIPAGATIFVDAYNASDALVETKYEVLATATDTTITKWFSGCYLNDAEKFVVRGVLPQASGSNYTVKCIIEEIIPDDVRYVEITNDGLVSGVNNLHLQLKDASAVELDTKGIIKIMVASDGLGSFGAATLLNGVAVGTDGELIETADDQRMLIMSEDDGDIDLNLTPTNAGTATVSILTFGTAAPTTGDTVTFGTEVYEFTTDDTTPLTAPTNIRIDMSAYSVTTHTTAAQAFKAVFNLNTSYECVASGAAAAITITALKYFVTYNSLATTASITATATGVWEDTTFGGGTGSSVTGVDPTAKYYLLIETLDGKRFVSDVLPYASVV
jgi:hypothetical protein